ncbi:MAG: class I SAM-dependent methyltransferase, partial [Parachlamydiaceae bacterium]|nr:class I SAM-dependent methyltransferase [Parachlamydiaceae bacterium]
MGFFELLWLKLVVMQRNAVEYSKVVWRYYGHRNFRRWDLALLWGYFLRNPYRICHNYLKEIGMADPYLYGETPLTSLQIIAEHCDLKKEDHVFELGCGRGRGCFWLQAFIGCKVTGIELVPTFVEKANHVKDRFKIDQIEFRHGDIAKANYDSATVLYLYGTCFEDAFIEQLINKFKKLPKGT